MTEKQAQIKPAVRRKLNGYRISHRNKWLILQDGILSLQSLMLLELYVDLFDFDSRHDTYGTLAIDFQAISTIFNCSVSSVRNWHKQLLQQGFIVQTDDKRVYKLINAGRYIGPGFWKGSASYYSTIEKNQPAKDIFQLMKQKEQPDVTKTTLSYRVQLSRALVSSKDDSSDHKRFGTEDEEWIKDHV